MSFNYLTINMYFPYNLNFNLNIKGNNYLLYKFYLLYLNAFYLIHLLKFICCLNKSKT